MIIECSSCRTRYMVQIGLFAQGGRKVRCARCKYEWHATLPTNIDVVLPSEDYVPIPSSLQRPYVPADSRPSSSAQNIVSEDSAPEMPASEGSANLPAVISVPIWKRKIFKVVVGVLLFCAFVAWPILDRSDIVKVLPGLRGMYEVLGLSVPPVWDGLLINNVRSELRYDSGTMKLYVDAGVHNSTDKMQFVPKIKASAIGLDGRVIQNWIMDASAPTIIAGGDLPIHSETIYAMERTIDHVRLEFFVPKDGSHE